MSAQPTYLKVNPSNMFEQTVVVIHIHAVCNQTKTSNFLNDAKELHQIQAKIHGDSNAVRVIFTPHIWPYYEGGEVCARFGGLVCFFSPNSNGQTGYQIVKLQPIEMDF